MSFIDGSNHLRVLEAKLQALMESNAEKENKLRQRGVQLDPVMSVVMNRLNLLILHVLDPDADGSPEREEPFIDPSWSGRERILHFEMEFQQNISKVLDNVLEETAQKAKLQIASQMPPTREQIRGLNGR